MSSDEDEVFSSEWGYEERHAAEIRATHPDPYAQVQLPMGTSTTIRVLEILPDATTEYAENIISCRLRLANLDDSYTALSYTWGSSSQDHCIILNGSPFFIGRNLRDFLMQERFNQTRDGRRLFWIDAICINQVCVLEKNHQVAMMGDIYARAAMVVIWLGSEGDVLVKLLNLLDNHDESEWSPHKFEKLLRHQMSYMHHLEYWSRAWILQECVLASELELQCGSKQFPESTINKLFRYLDMNSMNYAVWYILKARANWHARTNDKYISPWSMESTECSDARDRVYSRISLLDPRLQIVPDYNKTALDLFLEITDQNVGWSESYYSDMRCLALNLELYYDADGLVLGFHPGVINRMKEAEFLQYSNHTKDEFLAKRQWVGKAKNSKPKLKFQGLQPASTPSESKGTSSAKSHPKVRTERIRDT